MSWINRYYVVTSSTLAYEYTDILSVPRPSANDNITWRTLLADESFVLWAATVAPHELALIRKPPALLPIRPLRLDLVPTEVRHRLTVSPGELPSALATLRLLDCLRSATPLVADLSATQGSVAHAVAFCATQADPVMEARTASQILCHAHILSWYMYSIYMYVYDYNNLHGVLTINLTCASCTCTCTFIRLAVAYDKQVWNMKLSGVLNLLTE